MKKKKELGYKLVVGAASLVLAVGCLGGCSKSEDNPESKDKAKTEEKGQEKGSYIKDSRYKLYCQGGIYSNGVNHNFPEGPRYNCLNGGHNNSVKVQFTSEVDEELHISFNTQNFIIGYQDKNYSIDYEDRKDLSKLKINEIDALFHSDEAYVSYRLVGDYIHIMDSTVLADRENIKWTTTQAKETEMLGEIEALEFSGNVVETDKNETVTYHYVGYSFFLDEEPYQVVSFCEDYKITIDGKEPEREILDSKSVNDTLARSKMALREIVKHTPNIKGEK
ncbi:MAG: hypothetical protein RSD85_01830 [Erysipelotrichaceae bacterium]